MREELIYERGNEHHWKGGLMNGKERELSLLRFEISPDGRDTRRLLFNDDRI